MLQVLTETSSPASVTAASPQELKHQHQRSSTERSNAATEKTHTTSHSNCEPLSWNFLQHNSKVDSQLRSDPPVILRESTSCASTKATTNECNLMSLSSDCHLATTSSSSSSSAATSTGGATITTTTVLDIDNRRNELRGTKTTTTNTKTIGATNCSISASGTTDTPLSQTIFCNGFALTGGLLNVEILSQQIAPPTATIPLPLPTTSTSISTSTIESIDAIKAIDDLNVVEKVERFHFTTPTSTFRRKKQQHQHQQHLTEIENSTPIITATATTTTQKSTTTTTTTTTINRRSHNAATFQLQQQQQQHQQQQPGRRATMLTTVERRQSGNLDSSRRTLPSVARHQQQQHRRGNKMGVMAASNNNARANTNNANTSSSCSNNTEATTSGTRNRVIGVGGATGAASANRSVAIPHGADMNGLVGGIETYLGLIGWRKKCLYTLLLFLILLIITNLVLTLWILKVMEFSTDGMGQLKIVPGGIQLSGQAIIMDMLRASTIRSRHGQPISIESSRNFSINTRDANGMLENHLFLGHDKLECLSSGFHINDTNGRNLFSVNRKEVTIGAHALRIDGEGGAIFRESIQTPHVRAEPGRELRLESPTRELEITAAKDINLQSRAGGIELLALEDVKLRALEGSLRLESSKILMPNLRTAQPPLLGSAQNRDHLHRVFQLCACSNGKLFLASPHSICAGDDSTVCR